jgi:hypothetical protein
MMLSVARKRLESGGPADSGRMHAPAGRCGAST